MAVATRVLALAVALVVAGSCLVAAGPTPTPSSTSPGMSFKTCDVCDAVVNIVEGLKIGPDAGKVMDAVWHACDSLGPVTGYFCNLTVDALIEPILEGVANDEPAGEICDAIEACPVPNAVWAAVLGGGPTAGVDAGSATPECLACEALVLVAETLNVTADEDKALTDLYHFCDLLEPLLGGLCNETVNKYAATIFKAIQDGQPVEAICRSLRLCGASSSSSTAAAAAAVVVEKVEEEAVSLATRDECEACELIVTLVEEFNVSAYTSMIIDDLYKACDLLPPPLGELCNATVVAYAHTIIEEIESGTPPNQVCDKLKLCPPATTSSTHPPAAGQAAVVDDDEEDEAKPGDFQGPRRVSKRMMAVVDGKAN